MKEWSVKIADVKPGTVLLCDGDFTCLRDKSTRTVIEDEEGELYIACRQGRHYLCGQVEGDYYIGLILKEKAFEYV